MLERHKGPKYLKVQKELLAGSGRRRAEQLRQQVKDEILKNLHWGRLITATELLFGKRLEQIESQLLPGISWIDLMCKEQTLKVMAENYHWSDHQEGPASFEIYPGEWLCFEPGILDLPPFKKAVTLNSAGLSKAEQRSL